VELLAKLMEFSGNPPVQTAGSLWKTEGSKRAVYSTREELRLEKFEM
jgi:hypothetical protein